MIKQSPIIMEETKCSELSNLLISTHMKKKQTVIALKIREIKKQRVECYLFLLVDTHTKIWKIWNSHHVCYYLLLKIHR